MKKRKNKRQKIKGEKRANGIKKEIKYNLNRYELSSRIERIE